jgi:hypothetical protein
MENSPKKIMNIEYQKPPDYKIIPATGAYGGSTPQGEILCSFFVEYQPPPDSLKLEINPADGTSKEIYKSEKKSLIRELKVGILMRPDIAKAIGEWLIEKANNASIKMSPETEP